MFLDILTTLLNGNPVSDAAGAACFAFCKECKGWGGSGLSSRAPNGLSSRAGSRCMLLFSAHFRESIPGVYGGLGTCVGQGGRTPWDVGARCRRAGPATRSRLPHWSAHRRAVGHEISVESHEHVAFRAL